MRMKHISPDGKERVCRASAGNCRFEVAMDNSYIDCDGMQKMASTRDSEKTSESSKQMHKREQKEEKAIGFVVHQKNAYMAHTSKGKFSAHMEKERWLRKAVLVDNKLEDVAAFTLIGENGPEIHILNEVGTITVFNKLSHFKENTLKRINKADDFKDAEKINGTIVTMYEASASRIKKFYEMSGSEDSPSKELLENAELMRILSKDETLIHSLLKKKMTSADAVKEIRKNQQESGENLATVVARLDSKIEKEKREKRRRKGTIKSSVDLITKAEIYEHKTSLDIDSFRPRGTSTSKEIKSKEYLESKLANDVNMPIKDVLTYNISSTGDNLTKDIKSTIANFKRGGYKVTGISNTWSDEINPEKSVSVTLKTFDGYEFEVQFHTEESMASRGKLVELMQRRNEIIAENPEDTKNPELKYINKQMRKIQTRKPKDIENLEIKVG